MPEDEDSTPIPEDRDDEDSSPPSAQQVPPIEIQPDRPPPSVVFPGFKQVRIVDGKREEAEPSGADPDAATPIAPTRVPPPGREETLGGDQAQPADAPGNEETVLGAAPPPSGREATLVDRAEEDAPATPLSGREATIVGPDRDQAPSTPLSGREATIVGEERDRAPATPLSGREATIVGAGEAPPTPLSGREATMLGAAPTADAEAGDGTRPTLVPGSASGADEGTRATPPTYSARPGAPASSASFDANWHLAGRKGPHTGQTWGDFEIGGILGEGGMGAVYRAMQRSLKRRVAIKVLPPNLAQDAGLLRRFHLEASTSSKLSSPHIVQVYFIGEHEGNHYYAMEYVEGTDLYEVFKERRDSEQPITPEEAAEFILQGARGLAEAGRYGIVHRDIKPPNMMVDRSGLVKIADFGIVKVLGEHQLTMTGQAVGTPAYCSPEQGRGDGDIDQRSDLYSLGVVFYELACGKRPFEAATPNALIYKHCFDEPELPRQLNPAISSEIQAIILRLLQKKPENRYQSADELVRDLEAIKTGAMLESALANLRGTGADEAKREQMGWLQRHLVPVLLAAGVLVAAAGFGGYQILQSRQAEELAARRATEELRPTLAKLDETASLPPQVESLLDEYARLSPDGAEDTDLQRWRAKLHRVRALQAQLAALDQGASDAATRRAASVQLAEYTAEVGTEDPAAERWQGILDRLAAEERQIRERLRGLQAGVVTQSAREVMAERVERLAHLAGAGDPEVVQTRSRIASFDEQVAALTNELAVLDETRSITEAQRLRLLAALGQLSPLVGDSDERVLRWRQILDEAGGLVARTRSSLTQALGTNARLPLSVIEEVQGDLELFADLVAEDDRDLVNWRAQIEASQRRVATRRQRLAELDERLDEDGILPAPLLAATETTVTELAEQAGASDPDVLAWSETVTRSRTLIERLRRDLARLSASQPQPIPVAERAELARALARLVRLQGLEAATAERYRQRIADETARVAELRERLAVLDEPVPFTASLAADLARLAQDLGGTGPDLERWLAKRDRILALRESLAVLEERRSPGEDLQARFDALVGLVGPEAPEVQAWREKVELIAQLRARLAPLDQAASLPPTVDADLALLVEQVGTEDASWLRYRSKVDRVRELTRSLAALDEVLAADPERIQRATAELRELGGLVGTADPQAIARARRLAELRGPPQPDWAVDEGRDAFGRWADLAHGDLRMRFRYVPPGRFVMGSAEAVIGRDADEVAVPVRITRGFWLADAECTQAWYRALDERAPAYFAGPDRPVERVSLAEARSFLAALATTCGAHDARLPREAEWEFACRAGEAAPTPAERPDYAWYAANSGETTQPVRQRYANALGLYDLLGNVAEWTDDGYGAYPTAAAVDPHRSGGDRQVVRGGAWGDPATAIRPANRIAVDPGIRSQYLGFRAAIPAAYERLPSGAELLAELVAETSERVFSFRLGEALVSLTLPSPRSAAPTTADDSDASAAGEPDDPAAPPETPEPAANSTTPTTPLAEPGLEPMP